jgi:hypothetical protein
MPGGRGLRFLEWAFPRGRARRAPRATLAAAESLEQRREPPAVQRVAPAAAAGPPSAAVPVAERREPEPAPAPAPEPEVTPGPSLEPTPEPEREPPVEPAPPETPPDQPRVTAVAPVLGAASDALGSESGSDADATPDFAPFTARTLGVPQHWNLWELERVVRNRSVGDAIRDEERTFLLMYLRDFADADGVLPTSFDGIVREAFGDVLDAVRA